MEIPHVSLSRYYLVTFIWISRISFLTSLQFSTSIQPLSISSAFSSFDAWAGELIYLGSLLLLLLSHFSRVQLCATPWMAAHQAPPSLGFSRQEHWVGCHFLLQGMKVKSESEVTQSCPTLATPWTAAYQAPPSMGFSRQEYWSGMPLPSPPGLRNSSLYQAQVSTVGFPGGSVVKNLPAV